MHTRHLLIFSLLFVAPAFCEDSPFIVPAGKADKRASKNALKQEVGEHMKGTLQQCATLARDLGHLQAELAQVQQQLFEKVEALIDNGKPFKKATRAELQSSCKVLGHAKQKLATQVTQVRELRNHINQDPCLKKA